MNKVTKFLKDWQAVTDKSERDAAQLIADPKYTNHVKALNWTITIVGLIIFAYAVLG